MHLCMPGTVAHAVLLPQGAMNGWNHFWISSGAGDMVVALPTGRLPMHMIDKMDMYKEIVQRGHRVEQQTLTAGGAPSGCWYQTPACRWWCSTLAMCTHRPPRRQRRHPLHRHLLLLLVHCHQLCQRPHCVCWYERHHVQPQQPGGAAGGGGLLCRHQDHEHLLAGRGEGWQQVRCRSCTMQCGAKEGTADAGMRSPHTQHTISWTCTCLWPWQQQEL
jgi:hypothetical protein